MGLELVAGAEKCRNLLLRKEMRHVPSKHSVYGLG